MGKTTILIVEDEAIVAANLSGKLGKLGYEVVGITAKGEEAIELACSLKPAVVLMDIRLKGPMDGIEAAEAIRHRHSLPVIYLTAHSDSATLERAKQSDPFGYILKPFEERELSTTIEMALYKHQSDTEKKRAHEALKESEARLQAVNEELQIANEELQAQSEELQAQSEELQAQNEELARLLEESRRTEEALAKSQERLALALTSSGMATFEWDIVKNKCIWDDHVHSLLGTDPVTFTGTGEEFFRVMRPEDRSFVQAALSRAIEITGDYETEYRAVWPDGTIRHIAARGKVHCDSAGRADRMIGISWDITERKRAEEEKAKLETQLQQAQKMESVGRLAGGVAHDFNNMLCVIIGHTDMAMMGIDPDNPLHAKLTQIRKAADYSADLTRQLLAFARKQTIAPQVLDLNKTVARMLSMLQRLIGEAIRLTWQPAANLWQIKVDPSQIDQILANLCVNARDAISGVGKITIETGNITLDEDCCADHADLLPGEYVRIAVSDDGCGMDKEILAHIFEPFFTTKGVGEGTGLGLSSVYGAVKQNNGFIDVISEPDSGTTFAIYLPRHVGKADQTWMESATEPDLSGQETIILVEDEPDILNITRMMLEMQGYTILAASSPSDAIRLASEHSCEIQLLITDVIMPEMNGWELAIKLRSLYPHLKRLFMSGYTADIIAQHGVLQEEVYFVEKPFSPKTLAAKVREVLDSK
jgi:PAS domain S-box-containing protein